MSIEKKRPANWLNVPNIKPKKRHVCGNEYFGNKSKIIETKESKPYSNKGICKVYIKDMAKFLILEKPLIENGKTNRLVTKEEFQIVSLNEDKMVLRKVNDNGENL